MNYISLPYKLPGLGRTQGWGVWVDTWSRYYWAWVGIIAILLFMGGHGCNLKGKCRALL